MGAAGSPSTNESETGDTPGGANAAATGSSGATPPACPGPVIPDPPACTLARTVVVSSSFRPERTVEAPETGKKRSLPVVASVVRTDPDGAVESAEVWDALSGRFLHTLVKELEPRGSLQAAWTPDGRRVAIAGVGDSRFGFRIYDTAGFHPLFEDAESHWHFPCAVEIDPGAARVAMTTLLGVAKIHELETGTLLASLATNQMRAAGHVCSVLQWSGDGNAIQVEGLRESQGLRPIPHRTTRDPRPALPSEEELVMLSFAPKGDMAAFLDRRGNVRLFSKNGAALFKVLAAGKGVPPSGDPAIPPVRALSWRPDAGALATWDHTGKIRLWDAVKGEMVRELRAGGARLEGAPDPEMEDARLVWAPGGQAFAFWAGERPELWSLEDGRQKLAPSDLPMPDYPGIQRMSFSPDGSLLAVGRTILDTKSGAVTRRSPAPIDHWLNSGRFLSLASDYARPAPLRILRVADGAVLVLERLGDDTSPTLLAHTEEGVFQGPPELAACALPPPPEAPDAGAPDAGNRGGARPWTPAGRPVIPPRAATAATRSATTAGPPVAPPPLAPEPRDTLLADFWAGRPVTRTCPAP